MGQWSGELKQIQKTQKHNTKLVFLCNFIVFTVAVVVDQASNEHLPDKDLLFMAMLQYILI